MTIKIEIPSDNKPLAVAIGTALLEYGSGLASSEPMAPEAWAEKDFTKGVKLGETFEGPNTPPVDGSIENEYQALAFDLGAENIQKTGVHIAKAVGVYEQHCLANGRDPLSLDALTVLLLDGKTDITNAETILTAIYEATAPETLDTSAAFSQVSTSTGSDTTTNDEPLDEKGVTFNAEFCGKAAKPFYGSGKNKGQWKKRQGVDQEDYDQWYTSALQNVTVNTSTGEISTAEAFKEAKNDAPNDMGGLFTWISEMQNAKRITQADVDQSYGEAGVLHGDNGGPITMNDLISGNDSRGLTALGSINLIYNVLSKKAG